MQTIVPALLRRVNSIHYERERIDTPDGDFLDIDWLKSDTKKIALLIHGLEADTNMPYMKGMAKKLHSAGWCVAAMNLRGCSGEVNKKARAYHSGSTDDVETAVSFILRYYPCEEMVLVGFSLGGNLTLKFLGEKGTSLPKEISKAVTISVPCDLTAGSTRLDSRLSFIYRDRFLKTLKLKLLQRQERLPFGLTVPEIKKIASLFEFDSRYTAPMYGFRDAPDYYETCSAKKFIRNIKIPTLIITAKNDPFFTGDCLPFEECDQHPNVFLETPEEGGHVGFCTDLVAGNYYSEQRAIEFLQRET
jgi:predicted alpha/beta-fold hydrolase